MEKALKNQAMADLQEAHHFEVEDLYPMATKGFIQNVTVPCQEFEDADEVAMHPNKRRLVLIVDNGKEKVLWENARNNDPVTKEERVALEDVILVWGQNPETKEWAKAPKFVY